MKCATWLRTQNTGQVLQALRALVDTFVTENDQRIASEDPVDVYRGFYGPNTI